MQSSVLHICCLIISQVSPGLVSISHLPKAQLIAAAAQKAVIICCLTVSLLLAASSFTKPISC